MAMIVDRPPSADLQDSTPAPEPNGTRRASQAPQPARSWFDRYRQHVWIGGVSLIVLGAALAPIVLAPTAPKLAPVGPASASQPITVSITASEFTFSPKSIQVPVRQKIALTLNNNGSVEHDVTIPDVGFSLSARAGQSATGELTFDKPGVFDFICSIPGHKDAGMRGTVTVSDPQAASAPAPAQAASASSGMVGMPGMAVASSPDIKPLPADLKPLSAPQIAPPITRTEPAYVKFNLETTKVTALLANGVAYEYWTFNNTVPGPMLRVREGDTVEIDLSNAADAGMTHSIDLHAVNGPGGGASIMQIPPGENGSFKFEALTPGVYVYHCATPMVAEHVASGMYGLIVVEPKDGLPRVDHEYYLMEGDFYLQGQRGDAGLRAFDLSKMLDERPDYVLFNGGVGALTGANAFSASVGQSIRIFFGVGGPNLNARRRSWRACAVRHGPQRPPRYSHINHRSTPMTRLAHGMVGPVARLIESSVVQVPPARTVMLNASAPVQTMSRPNDWWVFNWSTRQGRQLHSRLVLSVDVRSGRRHCKPHLRFLRGGNNVRYASLAHASSYV